MFKIMPEHNLQRNGSRINTVPKWHELIKKWGLCLEGSDCPQVPLPDSGAAQAVPRAGLMEGEKVKLHGSVFKRHYNKDKESS